MTNEIKNVFETDDELMKNPIIKEIKQIFDSANKLKEAGKSDSEILDDVLYRLKTWKNDEIMGEQFRKAEK